MIKYPNTISRRKATHKILTHAIHGYHLVKIELKKPEDVVRYYTSKNIDFRAVVKNCRNWKMPVPEFENLAGSNWTTTEGANIVRVDRKTHKSLEGEKTLKEPGIFSLDLALSHFEGALRSLDAYLENGHLSDLNVTASQGMAALESFIEERTTEWNRQRPNDPFIDTKQNQVHFDEKIDKWVPKMTGYKIEKGKSPWSNFSNIRKFRNDFAIHTKNTSTGIAFSEIVLLINSFRDGVAELLYAFYLIYGMKVPSKVINAKYRPNVYLVKD